MKNRFALLLITLMVILAGCQEAGMNLTTERGLQADDVTAVRIIKDTGVIRYLDLEGGFYGILGKQGHYLPLNLPKAFQQEGLEVEFTATPEDGYSIYQWGVLVKLIYMKTLDTNKELIMDRGVIRQETIQGSPWVIKATSGQYQLLKLPEDFKIQNLEVCLVGVVRKDIVTIPPLWPLVEVLKIKRLSPYPLTITLSEEFKLPVKKQAFEPDERILFTFKGVLEDSRCPAGVECFWAGRAVIEVNINIRGQDYGNFKMATTNTGSMIKVGGYAFILKALRPYPVYGTSIDPQDYTGYFVIRPLYLIER